MFIMHYDRQITVVGAAFAITHGCHKYMFRHNVNF